MYLDAVKTAKVYARDFNRTSAIALALFGGKIRTLHGGCLLELNGWIFLRADNKLIECIVLLRELMERVFLDKVLDPHMRDSESQQFHKMHECINIYLSASTNI